MKFKISSHTDCLFLKFDFPHWAAPNTRCDYIPPKRHYHETHSHSREDQLIESRGSAWCQRTKGQLGFVLGELLRPIAAQKICLPNTLPPTNSYEIFSRLHNYSLMVLSIGRRGHSGVRAAQIRHLRSTSVPSSAPGITISYVEAAGVTCRDYYIFRAKSPAYSRATVPNHHIYLVTRS